jgi:hypothetical protein
MSFVLAIISFLILRINQFELLSTLIISLLAFYIPFYFNSLQKKDGLISPWLQHLGFWKNLVNYYFDGQINVEESLINEKQYIFCCFPHGTYTINHVLTMTDSCDMLSKIHTNARRDLVASILFYVPFLRNVI